MYPYNQLNRQQVISTSPEFLGSLEKFILHLSSVLPKTTGSVKLDFYNQFLSYLQVITLYLLKKNSLYEPLHGGLPANQTDRLQHALLKMAFHYGILLKKNDTYLLAEAWRQLREADFQSIQFVVEHAATAPLDQPLQLKKQIGAFILIQQLIAYYRGRIPQLKHIRYTRKWEKLIDSRQLDYEIRLSETLFQLTKLKIPHKIISPFDESYYTESGRNAFLNFTRDRFLACVQEINQRNLLLHEVLDIGCGYGNYIEALSTRFKGIQITGIELQENVCQETKTRFKDIPHIEIINQNIFDFHPEGKLDLILLNYVLFYFGLEEKERLFTQLYDQLATNGSILVCQYYAGIEPLKNQLAKKQGHSSLKFRIGKYYGNKILYANALWNEAADTFVLSEDWNEFTSVLKKTGFEVAAITHADPFYYSLFVEIKKSVLA